MKLTFSKDCCLLSFKSVAYPVGVGDGRPSFTPHPLLRFGDRGVSKFVRVGQEIWTVIELSVGGVVHFGEELPYWSRSAKRVMPPLPLPELGDAPDFNLFLYSCSSF